MRFVSRMTELGPLPRFAQEVVREERSQCRVPLARAVEGGPIHAAFVEALPTSWRDDPGVEVFSRMLFLKRGWYPIALGFHLDWAATDEAPGRVETLIANFGGCSFTEFVDDTFELPCDPRTGNARGPRVDAMVASGALRTVRMRECVLTHFDNAAWHRAAPAETTGWRLLVRAIRGLAPSQRSREGTFTSVRNLYVPQTPEEIERHAPYRT